MTDAEALHLMEEWHGNCSESDLHAPCTGCPLNDSRCDSALAHLRKRIADAVLYERKYSEMVEVVGRRIEQQEKKRVSRGKLLDAIANNDALGYLRELGIEVEP